MGIVFGPFTRVRNVAIRGIVKTFHGGAGGIVMVDGLVFSAYIELERSTVGLTKFIGKQSGSVLVMYVTKDILLYPLLNSRGLFGGYDLSPWILGEVVLCVPYTSG